MKFTAKQIADLLQGTIEGDPQASVQTLKKALKVPFLSWQTLIMSIIYMTRNHRLCLSTRTLPHRSL